jgi:pSer/pThr/pTyr-binding forkhead associated (FHA) protein
MFNEPKYILRYQRESGAWNEYQLMNEVIIGRSSTSDLMVDDTAASRQHARITVRPDGIWLADLGSSNGTHIGNQRLPSNYDQPIHPGQTFRIGNYTFMLVEAGSAHQIETPADSTPTAQFSLWYFRPGGVWESMDIINDITIGRGSDCGLSIRDGKASRNHSLLSVRPDGVWVSDLGSSNGTRLDDQRIQPHQPLQVIPGQTFTIGSHMFTVTPAAGASPPPPPRPIRAAASAPPPPRSVRGSRKQGGRKAGCIVAVLGGLAGLVCVCAAVGVFMFMLAPSEPDIDFPATQISLEMTRAAMDQPEQPQQQPDQPQQPDITQDQPDTPPDTPQQPDQSSEQTWLIILYQDADDQVLEEDIYFDMNEAEAAGSDARVRIVSQIDRYYAAYEGDGDWTSTRRYEIQTDSDLFTTGSTQISDMGEINMGDESNLADFALWAIATYPADRYALFMSDHGSGWPGALSDSDPEDEGIFLYEMDSALQYIVSQSGIGQFDLVGFDACLMGQIEVFSMLAPYAHYAIASEELEPAIGWAYTGFLNDLKANPDMDGGELGTAIVRNYIYQDQRVINDEARGQWLMDRGFGPDEYSAQDVAEALSVDVTLSVIDLAALSNLHQALNGFAQAMTSVDQNDIAAARSYARSYESAFGEDVPPSFIDLGHFVQLVQTETGDANIASAASNLLAAINQAVIAEMHGPDRNGSTGIAIYFPNSQLYGATYDDTYGFAYTTHTSSFAQVSLWDEFLEFHYTGQPIQ